MAIFGDYKILNLPEWYEIDSKVIGETSYRSLETSSSFQGTCPIIYKQADIINRRNTDGTLKKYTYLAYKQSFGIVYGLHNAEDTEAEDGKPEEDYRLGFVIGSNRCLTDRVDKIIWGSSSDPILLNQPEYVDLLNFKDYAAGNYDTKKGEVKIHSEDNYQGDNKNLFKSRLISAKIEDDSLYYVYYEITPSSASLRFSSLYPKKGNVIDYSQNKVYWIIGLLYKVNGDYTEEINRDLQGSLKEADSRPDPDDEDKTITISHDIISLSKGLTGWRWRQYWIGGDIIIDPLSHHIGTRSQQTYICKITGGGPSVYTVDVYESYSAYEDDSALSTEDMLYVLQGNSDTNLPVGHLIMGTPAQMKSS